MLMRRALFTVACALMLCALPAPAAAAGLTPETLWSVVRLGDPQPSADGETIAFTARRYDMESNSSTASIWLVPTAGGTPRRLTQAPVRDGSPRWLGDSPYLLFTSSRDGGGRLWAVDTRGGEPWPLSDLPLPMGGFRLAPAGDRVVFTLEVAPDCEDLECSVERQQETASSPVRVYTELLFRHWDSWEDGLRTHLFTASLRMDDEGRPLGLGEPRDLMQGLDVDSPTHPFGGMEETAIAPDGTELIYAAKALDGSEAAWSTDVDLFRVPLDGSQPPRKLTTGNRAWDTGPAFSPDGRWLAYTAMERPGFEADRFRIMLRPRQKDGSLGEARVLAPDWDRSAAGLVWSPDSESLIVTAQETGHLKLFRVALNNGQVTPLVDRHHNTGAAVTAQGTLVYMQDSSTSPSELFTRTPGGRQVALTRMNEELLADVAMRPAEDFWFEGAGGEPVHGWLVRPAGDPPQSGKWPVAFLIHGGPQGAWSDQFHYRWNPQIYAGAGYLTLAINFHGSTGYGQAFTDSITGDWGGAPYEDLMKGLDHLLATDKSADGDRMCALGASYGGYMINWVAGHTSRFNCLVNHDGLFDLRSMYYTTEELWFPEWEMGGPAWAQPEMYKRFSPSEYVANWVTPMLVIHGGLDFRVPETEGFATFTALRRRGVPARLLYYPDENHWVLRPQGARRWHQEVLDWMARWTAAEGADPQGD